MAMANRGNDRVGFLHEIEVPSFACDHGKSFVTCIVRLGVRKLVGTHIDDVAPYDGNGKRLNAFVKCIDGMGRGFCLHSDIVYYLLWVITNGNIDDLCTCLHKHHNVGRWQPRDESLLCRRRDDVLCPRSQRQGCLDCGRHVQAVCLGSWSMGLQAFLSGEFVLLCSRTMASIL